MLALRLSTTSAYSPTSRASSSSGRGINHPAGAGRVRASTLGLAPSTAMTLAPALESRQDPRLRGGQPGVLLC